MLNNWFATGTQAGIKCINCNKSITEVGYTHTNTGVCPNCKIPCIFYGVDKENVIQIIPHLAPKYFQKFIQWVQSDLTEIEFMGLLGVFSWMNDTLSEKNKMK